MGHQTLILGGVRSGKSRFALEKGSASGSSKVYIATAQPLDSEMVRRIQKHRSERPPDWKTIEEPFHPAEALRSADGCADVAVIDCLTLWLSNLLSIGNRTDEEIQHCIEQLIGVMGRVSFPVIAVSNEVSLGVVPADPLSRRFIDFSGFLHQRLARSSEEVFWMTAGIPVPLKKRCHGNS